MTVMDADITLTESQTVTVSAATTDYWDKQAAGDANPNLYMVITVNETVTAAGAATVSFVLQEDTASNFASAVDVLTSEAYGKAVLTAGRDPIIIPMPVGRPMARYIRGYFTIGTGPLTAGKFTVYFTDTPPTNRAVA